MEFIPSLYPFCSWFMISCTTHKYFEKNGEPTDSQWFVLLKTLHPHFRECFKEKRARLGSHYCPNYKKVINGQIKKSTESTIENSRIFLEDWGDEETIEKPIGLGNNIKSQVGQY
uniref:Peptide chain release factor 2 n=1 Tax=Anthurium amnicola TaxID=1678845 RepID=A0A1D1YSA3_9ARAE